MNVRNRRGIENLLLRRVRRHQSMTALFRAPGMDSERPPQLQTRLVGQKEEQDSPAQAQMAEVSSSIPAVAPRSGTVARQLVSPPASAPNPLTPLPSTPPVTESSRTPDPVWKRLQTIFRKHEEHNDPHTTDMEAGTTDPVQRQAHEEKESSQTISTEEHLLPAQDATATIPLTRAVQRSSENTEQNSELVSPNVLRKAQPLPSVNPETTATVRNAEFKPALPNKMPEVNDQVSADDEPEKPSLPLETVWNVQRVEASHPLFRESTPQPAFDSTDVDANETSMKTSQVHDQKSSLEPIQLHQEVDGPAETRIPDSLPTSGQGGEPHAPVEILSPSRPRPPQMDLPPNRVNIQRQSQDSHASKEISEASPVNTAIGPLPADLWWLLGQKPPSDTPTSQLHIQRTIQHDQKQVSAEQSNVATPQIPAEHPAEVPSMSNTIQKQVLSKDPLPSSQEEPTSLPRAEETKHAEPDLDDLARRVYAEVRRRLAAEWERRR